MFGYKCEECEEGTIRTTVKENFTTKIEGDEFIVPEATIGVCDNCGAINYSGKEIERWKDKYHNWKKQAYVSAREIKKIRKKLDLNQEEFADLIGVSRQSLIEWEKDQRKRTQPNSINIILKSIKNELNGKLESFIQNLIDQYEERTHTSISVKISNRKSSREAKFKSLLPVSTSKILDKRAEENNTDILTEAVRLIEVNVFQSMLYSSPFEQQVLQSEPVLDKTAYDYNSVETKGYSGEKKLRQIAKQSYRQTYNS